MAMRTSLSFQKRWLADKAWCKDLCCLLSSDPNAGSLEASLAPEEVLLPRHRHPLRSRLVFGDPTSSRFCVFASWWSCERCERNRKTITTRRLFFSNRYWVRTKKGPTYTYWKYWNIYCLYGINIILYCNLEKSSLSLQSALQYDCIAILQYVFYCS
jgi:hypothetical protein